MIIKAKNIALEDFGAVKVKELFNDPKMENISAAIVKVEGLNRPSKNAKSDIFYYVIEGTGNFKVDGQNHQVEKGDLVLISKNTTCQNIGTMTLLAISSPRYNESDVEYLD